MVANRLRNLTRYSLEAQPIGGGTKFDLVQQVVGEILPHLRVPSRERLDVSMEMPEYETAGPEGKYTHGVYSKLKILGSKEPEQDLSDDDFLSIIEEHLLKLNADLVALHRGIQEGLSRMDAMEKEKTREQRS